MRIDFDVNLEDKTSLQGAGTESTRSGKYDIGYVAGIPEGRTRPDRGQTLLRYVYNDTGVAIPDGTVTVRDLTTNTNLGYHAKPAPAVAAQNQDTVIGVAYGIIGIAEYGWVVFEGPVQVLASSGGISAGVPIETAASGEAVDCGTPATDPNFGYGLEAGTSALTWCQVNCRG